MNFRRTVLEDLPHEETVVWSCSSEGCKGWIRDNFAFAHQPTCHLCRSPMVSSMKLLPLLVNTNRDMKAIKDGIRIS